ncbi:hypothetical protein EDB84DRAFT_1134679 [Lactarius hengduanensis]|nr:hypothetical protein EDB84DRAFT_1134679 [Lactarius hengduanensis]
MHAFSRPRCLLRHVIVVWLVLVPIPYPLVLSAPSPDHHHSHPLTCFRHSCRLLSVPARCCSASLLHAASVSTGLTPPRARAPNATQYRYPAFFRSLPVLTAPSTSLSQPSLCLLSSPPPSPPLLYPLRHRIHVRIQRSLTFLRTITMNMRERERRLSRWSYLCTRRRTSCKQLADG